MVWFMPKDKRRQTHQRAWSVLGLPNSMKQAGIGHRRWTSDPGPVAEPSDVMGEGRSAGRDGRVQVDMRKGCWFASLLTLGILAQASVAAADTLVGDAAGRFSLTTVASGLEIPTDFRFLPDGRIVIVELGGRVLLRNLDGSVVEAGTISAVQPPKNGEMGLFSVEVHPDFVNNRLLYFYYARSDEQGGSDLDRDRLVTIALGTDDTLDMATETVLVDHLQGPANHHGGGLGIGKDGKLYLGVGDTGCTSGRPPEPASTPANFFPTCLSNPQGKILRLELDGSIPADNPLVGVGMVTACGETCDVDVASTGLTAPDPAIWAWGFRNPFRLWIDPTTNLPWVGDVGEISYEEIDVVQGGRHHGWPWREGAHGWPSTQCAAQTPGAACVDPVYECRHGGSGPDSNCVAVTGGAIVDDCSWPEDFRGRYYFADSGAGTLSSLQPTEDRKGVVPGSRKEVAVLQMPVALRPGPAGDLYVVDIYGRLSRLAPLERAECALPTIEARPPAVESLGTPAASAPGAAGCGCASGRRTDGVGAFLSFLVLVVRWNRRR